jgi:hypothetical protein
MILVDTRRRALHDRLVRTVVIYDASTRPRARRRTGADRVLVASGR